MDKRHFRRHEKAFWKEKNAEKGLFKPRTTLKPVAQRATNTVSLAARHSKTQKTFVTLFYFMYNISLSCLLKFRKFATCSTVDKIRVNKENGLSKWYLNVATIYSRDLSQVVYSLSCFSSSSSIKKDNCLSAFLHDASSLPINISASKPCSSIQGFSFNRLFLASSISSPKVLPITWQFSTSSPLGSCVNPSVV